MQGYTTYMADNHIEQAVMWNKDDGHSATRPLTPINNTDVRPY